MVNFALLRQPYFFGDGAAGAIAEAKG